MRIAANLNVLDEVQFIEQCIRHLRTIGIDVIVLTDLGSVDGTSECLEAFAGDPDISLIRMRRDEDPWGFPARMYERTIAEFEVDRVLFIDADEFWLPKGGNLKTIASLESADALVVSRLNVPLVEGRPILPGDLSPAGYSDLYLVASPVKGAQKRFQSDPHLAWITTEVGPKTIINPRTVAGVGTGTHQIVAKDRIVPKVVKPDDVIIAHVPFSTADRFTRKLDNIARSLNVFGHRLVGAEAWHWRRWLQIAQEGKVDEEFRRQALTEVQFQTALTDGTIQSAESVLETMAAAASRN